MSNLWLFAPLLKLILASKPQTATLVRTTTAITVVRAGEKNNVLPSIATAIIDHRVHPSDTIASVIARDHATINDPRVKIEVEGEYATEPSPVSSTEHPAYAAFVQCVQDVFPNVTPAPGLFVASSDSKHYWAVAEQIYRFNPIQLTAAETKMFHGFDERISVEGHAKSVAWFRAMHALQAQRCPSKANAGKPIGQR
mmetsp:Transcript_35938/g.94523  ORF Transcript_35938/g.94523 Transcript_35938/m.94523 type:complete len:197 (+) Transcript_35938:490-1080(+)